MGFLELQRQCGVSHEVLRGAQGASHVALGKSGIHAHCEGERVIALSLPHRVRASGRGSWTHKQPPRVMTAPPQRFRSFHTYGNKALRDEGRGAASLEGRWQARDSWRAGLRGWDDFLAQTLIIIIIEACHTRVWSFPGAGPCANTLRAHTSPLRWIIVLFSCRLGS